MIPKMGFGTWELRRRKCERSVRDALEIGYRHIDTAVGYENEDRVGRAIAASPVDRSEILLATKLRPEDLAPERVRASTEASLRALSTDYLDLLLIHWPNPDIPLESTLGAMLELREAGRVRDLGVANFPSKLFREALDLAPVVVNQVEYHVFLAQDAVRRVCEERRTALTAYSPLARGKVDSDPTLREIAESHGATPGQVALRWLMDQPRVTVIPKSGNAKRRRENFAALEVELTDSDRARIAALPKDRRSIDPAWAPSWD